MSGLLGFLGNDKDYKRLKEIPMGSVTNAVSVPSGFDMIDYECATICTDIATGEEFIDAGLPWGKIYLFAGNSQGGKTTLGLQIAESMTRVGGEVILLDYERSQSNPAARIGQICGITREDFNKRFSIFNHADMSTEFFKELLFKIKEYKETLKKADMIEWTNVDGETVFVYPPTVVLCDSIPAMKPLEVLNDAKLDNNMVGGKMAAANSALVKSITSLLERFNITIIAINHITTKINTNMYAPRKVQIPGLGEDENLPGGNAWVYNPSYIFKLTSGKELKADKEYGIEGRVTEVRILKTRSGFNNKRLPFILHGRIGFSNAFTILEYAKTNKMLKGTGRGYFIDSLPDTKFTLKNFYNLYRTDEVFQEAFDEAIQDSLADSVNTRYADINAEDEEAGLEDEFDEAFD